jgi:fructokinase
MNTKFKIAGIGELLWDLLPQGKQLGGAPCNFAFHALQAGCETYVISAVGTDKEGEEILQVMNQLNLNRSFVQATSKYPTGTVSVMLDSAGIPDYTIHENVAWDHIEWGDRLESLAQEIDAVCFGSLAQRNPVSKMTIWRFIEATKAECLKVFDINLRQSFYSREDIIHSLEIANVLKLNEDELPILCGYLGYEGDEEQLLTQLLRDFQLKLIAFTQGGKGSLLITSDERSFCDVPEIEIADTVGAGDSFTAILLTGMLFDLPLARTHALATEIAAYVCTRNGATPRLPQNLINLLTEQ